MRDIVFSQEAMSRIQKQILWYGSQYSEKSVRTMTRNLHRDISALASMPTIGKAFRKVNGKQFYTFPSKKKADIVYTFDETKLYVADVIFYFAKR